MTGPALFAREDEFLADVEALARRALAPVSAGAGVRVFLAVVQRHPAYAGGGVRVHPPLYPPERLAALGDAFHVWDAARVDLGPARLVDFGALGGGYAAGFAEPPAAVLKTALAGETDYVTAAVDVEFERHDALAEPGGPPGHAGFAGALAAQVRLPSEPPPGEDAGFAAVDRERLAGCVCHALLARAAEVAQWYVTTRETGLLPAAGEVLRAGGRRLAESVVPRGGAMSGSAWFDAFTTLSSLPYEGNEARGRIVVPPAAEPRPSLALELAEPVELDRFKAVRKLLEMCAGELYLVSDGARVLGLARGAPAEGALTVRFDRHHWWELRQGGTLLMGVRYGEPALPQPRVDRAGFGARFAERFAGVPGADPERIWPLVQAAMRQAGGALIVVSRNAADEAVRLRASSTPVRPGVLDEELVLAATSIDGGVLLAPDGTCHAVGVILDGIAAASRGSAQRGSRYNQTLRYVATNPGTLAVVVSDDGDVELV